MSCDEDGSTPHSEGRRRFLAAGAAAAATGGAWASPTTAQIPIKLWTFGASMAAGERQFEIEIERPERLRVANDAERRAAHRALRERLSCEEQFGQSAEMIDWDAGLEPPVLEITEPDFAPNYLQTHGVAFVSRRLREAMALPPETVEWRPVEMGSATEAATAQDYKRMGLRVFLDVIDPVRADYQILSEVTCEDGSRVSRRFAQRIYWRMGLEPSHDLFRARFSGVVVATDPLATRVLHAGVEDVAFFDQQRMQELYDRDGVTQEIIVKTL